MLFIGHHEHSIDAKCRLAIPKAIRTGWRRELDGEAWYALPWVGGVIRLYTEREFEARSSMGRASLTADPDEATLRQTLFGLAARLEMDAAGRIRLPEDMLALVGLGNEVALVGLGAWLEIHDRAAWRTSKKGRLQQLPDVMRRLEAKGAGAASASE